MTVYIFENIDTYLTAEIESFLFIVFYKKYFVASSSFQVNNIYHVMLVKHILLGDYGTAGKKL